MQNIAKVITSKKILYRLIFKVTLILSEDVIQWSAIILYVLRYKSLTHFFPLCEQEI